jgi:hypothetical protein
VLVRPCLENGFIRASSDRTHLPTRATVPTCQHLCQVKRMHHDGLKVPQTLLDQCGSACSSFAPHIDLPAADAAVAGPPQLAAALPRNSPVVKRELSELEKEGGARTVLERAKRILQQSLGTMEKIKTIVGS